MNSRTWNTRLLMLSLTAGLALAACGDDPEPNAETDAGQVDTDTDPDFDAGDSGETQGDADAEPGGDIDLSDYEYKAIFMTAVAYPDRIADNGSVEVDPDLVPVEFSAELTARLTSGDEASEVPITDATVFLGEGDESASRNDDFTFMELTNQGDGLYTGESVGTVGAYRARFESQDYSSAYQDLKPNSLIHITSPLDGQPLSASSDIQVRYEPIEGGRTVLRLNGEEIMTASGIEEQNSLIIPADELTPGTHEITLERPDIQVSSNRAFSYSYSRTITVEVQ